MTILIHWKNIFATTAVVAMPKNPCCFVTDVTIVTTHFVCFRLSAKSRKAIGVALAASLRKSANLLKPLDLSRFVLLNYLLNRYLIENYWDSSRLISIPWILLRIFEILVYYFKEEVLFLHGWLTLILTGHGWLLVRNACLLHLWAIVNKQCSQ